MEKDNIDVVEENDLISQDEPVEVNENTPIELVDVVEEE